MNSSRVKNLFTEKTFIFLMVFIIQMAFLSLVNAEEFRKESKKLFIKNTSTGALASNQIDLKTLLLSDNKTIQIALPLPNGEFVDFELTPESIMADLLAKKYSNIRTFSGFSLENPKNTGRFDITDNGFHGMFYHNGERVFIEPTQKFIKVSSNTTKAKRLSGNTNEYKSYYGKHSHLAQSLKHKFHSPKIKSQEHYLLNSTQFNKANKPANLSEESESAIKTFRIASIFTIWKNV